MYLESKILAAIAKLFAVPPIIAGYFSVAKGPDGLVWGVSALIIGAVLVGFKRKIYINKHNIKVTVGIYGFIVMRKTIKITEFTSIYLGLIKGSGAAEGRASFDVVFPYKYPNNYMTGNHSVINGYDINDFFWFGKRKRTQKNFDILSNGILKEISVLTGLPIKYAPRVEKLFVKKAE